MKPRRLLTMIVLAIATLAAAAHVCVVPHAHALDLHPHAWDAAVTANAPSEHSDQPKDADAIHDASRTGLRDQRAAPTPDLTTTRDDRDHLLHRALRGVEHDDRFCGPKAYVRSTDTLQP